MSKVISVDVDGVCSDYNTAMRLLLQRFGASLREFEDGLDPNVWNWYPKYGALPPQVDAAIIYTQENPYWWEILGHHRDFTREAKSLLKELTIAHEVSFITSRPKGTRDATEAWFWGQADISAQVIVSVRKKAPIWLALDVDFTIEDNYPNLVQYMEMGGRGQCILVKRAYNKEGWTDSRLVLVESTLEALKVVEK